MGGGATSWRERCIRALERQAGVGTVVADQCQYGLVPRGPDGQPMPAKTATRFMSSAPALLEALGRRCGHRHRHQVLEGSGRAAAAARYPAGLCRAILRGAEAQRRRGGDQVPAGVRQLHARDLGVFELRRSAGEVAGAVLEVDATSWTAKLATRRRGKPPTATCRRSPLGGPSPRTGSGRSGARRQRLTSTRATSSLRGSWRRPRRRR